MPLCASLYIHPHPPYLTTYSPVVAFKNLMCCIASIPFTHWISKHKSCKKKKKERKKKTNYFCNRILGIRCLKRLVFLKQFWPWLRKEVLSSLENCEKPDPITSPRPEVLRQGISAHPLLTPQLWNRRNRNQKDFIS